ncbi:MAG: hypothetical protein PHR28_13305 [candidate division Zixibacteria bacterium]|nr:hypothetical protein [candidate division Zixibacteria bacterium]
MKKYFAISGIILMAAAIMGGCNGTVTGPGYTPKYRVEGILVKSLDGGSARIDLTLTKDSLSYKKAVITLGTTILDTNTLGYTKIFASGAIQTGQNYQLNIHDSTSLNVNLIIAMPGSFAINNVSLPADRIYAFGAVGVDWTISAGTDGYILADVPPSEAISNRGDTAYYDATEGAIRPDAFRYNDIAVSGTHLVYVAAYTGAPVSAPAVPFAIPVANDPADNVSKNILFGRLAGMVVAAPDSVVVP